jgi:putative transcriptional regulator
MFAAIFRLFSTCHICLFWFCTNAVIIMRPLEGEGAVKLLAILSTNGHVRAVCLSLHMTLALLLLIELPAMHAASARPHTVWLPFRPLVSTPGAERQGATLGLARGRFLVASRSLSDANFAETAIFLIDYHQRGAMGLIINKPTEVPLAKVWPDMAGLRQRPDTVYIGGPVATRRIMLLIRSGRPLEDAQQVIDNIHVSTSQQIFARLVEKTDAAEQFRVYAGYAGWGPGQLEREVARGDWHVLPADATTVFDTAPADVWPTLIRKGTIRWLRF